MADETDIVLEWGRFGENDWSAKTPSRAVVVYAGPRFALVDPGPTAGLNQRLNLNIDLRFDHRLSLNRRGKAAGAVSRETGLDRLARRVGYAVEHATGDPDFDRRIYLGLDDPEAARALGDDPKLRRLLLELFDSGVIRIEAGPQRFQARLAYTPSPAMDGGRALSGVAIRLDALARRWPKAKAADGPFSRVKRLGRAVWGLAWAGGWIAAILATAFFAEEADARQLETFTRPDWAGLAILFALMVVPAALLFARLANAHKWLLKVMLAALAVLPFSYRLRVVEANRLAADQPGLVQAEMAALAENPHGPCYLALVSTAGRPTEWTLSRIQGDLAREGRLCAAGITAEGRRGLRYVTGVRTWECRPGEPGRRVAPGS